jgi:Domain of unknown function (DUF4845)
MYRRQRGATALGMLIIVAIIGFALYGGIRLTPMYLEYMAIVRAMEQTAKENTDGTTSPQELRTALDRRWTIEDIKSIQPKEIEIKRTAAGYTMRAYYDAEVPFVANVFLVARFDKTVDVK